MDPRYARNTPALSPEECALLRAKKVAVIGCGGLGGYLIEYLARLGIGSIVAVDGDVFEQTNLNRQLLSSPALLGLSKAEAAVRRVQAINPDVNIRGIPLFLEESNARELIAGCDAVLDGLDAIPARKALARACAAENIPYIHGAIQGWTAQAALSMPGDGLLDRLYPEGVAITDKSVLSFTPALCAAMQTALCAKLLTGKHVDPGKLYLFDLLYQDFEIIPLI